VNLENIVSAKNEKTVFLKLARSMGVWEERTDHTKLFSRTFTGSGDESSLSRHQKVNFSTFDGKVEFQCIRNCFKNLPFCPGSPQNTFLIFLRYVETSFSPNEFYRNQTSENMEIATNRKSIFPGSLTRAQEKGMDNDCIIDALASFFMELEREFL